MQLVKIVFDTSSGMMKMMRNEKYHAVRTATVTNTGCLITFEYLHSNTAASKKAMQMSKMKTVYAMVRTSLKEAHVYYFFKFISYLKILL